MNSDKLKELQLPQDVKHRPGGPPVMIFTVVLIATGAAAYLAWPRAADAVRKINKPSTTQTNPTPASQPAVATTNRPAAVTTTTVAASPSDTADVVLETSGYIINRERIEISPRFMGTVTWIGVKK